MLGSIVAGLSFHIPNIFTLKKKKDGVNEMWRQKIRKLDIYINVALGWVALPAEFPWTWKTSNVCMKCFLNLRNVQVSMDVIPRAGIEC